MILPPKSAKFRILRIVNVAVSALGLSFYNVLGLLKIHGKIATPVMATANMDPQERKQQSQKNELLRPGMEACVRAEGEPFRRKSHRFDLGIGKAAS